MELKLLTVAARRADAQAAPARPQFDGQLRAEMQRLEARVAARMEAHEKSMAQMQQAASEAVTTLRGQLAVVSAQIAAAQEHMGPPTTDVHALSEQAIARVEQTVGSIGQRVAGVEQGLDELRRNAVTLQENLAADLREFEQNLKTQAGAVESARTAMAQTDDLVERVVEALELLQSSVLDQQEDRAAMVN
jgi:chromosome segregation ATPase